MSGIDVINPSVQVEAARIAGSNEAMSRAFKGAGLQVEDQEIAIANARDPKYWRSRARIIRLVDSLNWILPYLR